MCPEAAHPDARRRPIISPTVFFGDEIGHQHITVDELVVATDRTPSSAGIGLAGLGLDPTVNRGYVKADKQSRGGGRPRKLLEARG